MSIWELNAAVQGYVDANTVDDGSMSPSEQDELWEWMKAKEGYPN